MKTYAELLQEFPPKAIKDKESYESNKEVANSFRTKNATADEIEYIELLDVLRTSYRNKESGYIDTLNLNFYLNWGVYTPETQIALLYEELYPLQEDEGYELILSEGQEQRIRPITYKPDLDISFSFDRTEVISGEEYNLRIEKITKDGYEKILKECKRRNAKKIILLAYIYSSPRDSNKSNDVGVLVNFG